MKEIRENGRRIWEVGGVWQNLEDSGYIVTSISSVRTVRPTGRGVLCCSCNGYMQTGKDCEHTYAATLFHYLSPFMGYISRLQQLDSQDRSQPQMFRDGDSLRSSDHGEIDEEDEELKEDPEFGFGQAGLKDEEDLEFNFR